MTTEPVIKAYQGGTTTVDTTVMSITLTTSGSAPGTPQLTNCSGTSGYSTTTESNGVVTVTDSSGHGGTFAVSGCDFSGQFFYDVNSGAVGTPYTMTASANNVTSATSQPFAANRLRRGGADGVHRGADGRQRSHDPVADGDAQLLPDRHRGLVGQHLERPGPVALRRLDLGESDGRIDVKSDADLIGRDLHRSVVAAPPLART